MNVALAVAAILSAGSVQVVQLSAWPGASIRNRSLDSSWPVTATWSGNPSTKSETEEVLRVGVATIASGALCHCYTVAGHSNVVCAGYRGEELDGRSGAVGIDDVSCAGNDFDVVG